jgi:hypothetical protein
MLSALRRGAIMLTLIGTVAFAAAHLFDSDPGRRIAGLAAPVFGVEDATGSIEHAAQDGWIQLSDEQRGWIFLGVMNLTDVPDANVPVPEPTLGAAAVLPPSVELQDLPAMVTRKIPEMRHHKFVKLDDRILLVRPGDRVVVSEIPRYRLLP